MGVEINNPHVVTVARLRAFRSYLDRLLETQVIYVMERDSDDMSPKARTRGKDQTVKGKGIAHFYV